MKKRNFIVCLLLLVVMLPAVAFAQTHEEWHQTETLQQATDVFEVTYDGRRMRIVTVLDEGTKYEPIERIVTQDDTAFDSYFFSDSPIEWIRISYRDRNGNVQQGWIVANTDAITGINMGVFDVTSNESFTAFIVGGNADRVHLRSRPSQVSDSLGLYFEGTPVTCYGSLRETWVPVQIGHEQGYMMSAFLSNQIEETYPLNETRRGIVRTDSWVNLTSEPSAESQALVQLQEGTQLLIMGETSSHWYYASYNGLAGYVSAEHVELQSTPHVRDHITSNVIDVLTGHNIFWHTGVQEGMYLSMVGDRCFESDGTVSFPRFTIADVDQDGNDEIVLAMTVGKNEYYGYLVLKNADDTVWGYEVYYRAMLSLKADGTFSFSSGALDNGFGYKIPEGDRFHSVGLAESVSSYDNIEYFLNGKKVSESVYRDAIKGQMQKPDAIWYDLTNENLLAICNPMFP